mmetsp:Transcript_2363/g.3522  ORF Transcript_2363/g.3522 Transcript_2363/m.3522 type:complete len:426 (-) Transcript_2363:28-1305(-)
MYEHISKSHVIICIFMVFTNCIRNTQSLISSYRRSGGLSQRRAFRQLKQRCFSSSSSMSDVIGNHNIQSSLHENSLDLFSAYFPIYYNDVYEVPLPPNHRFPMEKYRQVRERVQENINNLPVDYKTNVQSEFRISPLISLENLTTTHCPDYVERYMKGNQTDQEVRNVGFPWSLKGVARSLSSTGGTVAAAKSMCEAKKRQLSYIGGIGKHCKGVSESKDVERQLGNIWGAHLAGGTHHAFRDRGEGFCVFSDIAVAANTILRDYPDFIKKILIIDLDVHQGNGNSVLFQGRNDVITFSVHCSSNYFSPKEDSDLDIELPPGCNDATYLATLNHWLQRISKEAEDVDFVFFQAGVDILNEDRLGRMDVSQDGVARRNKMVFDFANQLKVPLCITMGGGYPKKSWEPILSAHSNVYTQAFSYLADN